MSSSRIPVVMYHSVGRPDPDWIWGELICPLPLFTRQLERFVAGGFVPATLDDVNEEQAANVSSRKRRVVLSFDDGYLDNWVHVYPLLKKSGWRGIVYINPDFVDPGEQPRPTLEDVWAGRCAERDLQARGFLNWAEIEMLDRSGVLEIGSHSMSHTWYPTGPEIADFHRPGRATPWLAWNARPERKPFYLNEDQSGFVPWGMPVYKNGRSLGVRRYIPDPDVAAATIAHVAARGGATCFDADGWLDELRVVAREADRGGGRLETDQEMLERFAFEIGEAAGIFEARLGRRVHHFCWPGGAYCDESWQLVEQADYRTFTVKRNDLKRWNGSDPRLVRRISDHKQYTLFGRSHGTDDAGLLIAGCDAELGRIGARARVRLRKIFDIAGRFRTGG